MRQFPEIGKRRKDRVPCVEARAGGGGIHRQWLRRGWVAQPTEVPAAGWLLAQAPGPKPVDPRQHAMWPCDLRPEDTGHGVQEAACPGCGPSLHLDVEASLGKALLACAFSQTLHLHFPG